MQAVVSQNEHPRADTTLETVAKLNRSTIPTKGAAALILASAEAVKKQGLTARTKVRGMASAGVAPRVMGISPVPAVRKLIERLGVAASDLL